MPESRARRQRAASQDQPASSGTPAARNKSKQPNPPWFKPVMFGFMILGLLWIIAYYITQGLFPVPAWGAWNIAAGFGISIVGFLMSTRWR